MPTASRKLIIAIDGPAGAGKSTIAARLARDLGYVNLESGAMYRALALKAIEHDLALDDEPALVKLAQQSHIALEPTRSSNRVLLDERDVSQRVREADVTDAASKVSVHPGVREWMVARQREMGAGGGVVTQQVPERIEVNGAVHDRVRKDARQQVEIRLGLARAGQVVDGFEVQGHRSVFLDRIGREPGAALAVITVVASTACRGFLWRGRSVSAGSVLSC